MAIYKAIIFFLFICSFSSAKAMEINSLQKSLKEMKSQVKHSIVVIKNKDDDFTFANKNVTENSQFYIGSLTKQITAYMFLITLQSKFPNETLNELVTKKLSDLFPDSKFLRNLERQWVNEVSALDLLTHKSGLSDYINYYNEHLHKPQLLNNPINVARHMQVIRFNREKPYQYSNSNYLLLGSLIEEIRQEGFGQSFDKLVKQPIKMENSYALVSGNYKDLRKKPEFKALQVDFNSEVFIDFANCIGAGNIISTAKDLMKWQDFLYNKSDPEIRKIMLSAYHIDKEDNDEVNLGLTSFQNKLGKVRGFQGVLDSYHSFMVRIINLNMDIIVLSNNEESFKILMKEMNDFLGLKKEQ